MLSANLRPCSNNNNNKDPEQLFCTSRSLQERNTKHFQPAFIPSKWCNLFTSHLAYLCACHRFQAAERRYQPSNVLHARIPPHQHKAMHPSVIHLPCYEPCECFSPLDKTKHKATACWDRVFPQATLPSQHRESSSGALSQTEASIMPLHPLEPEISSKLTHWVPVCPWQSHLTSLKLSKPSHKISWKKDLYKK